MAHYSEPRKEKNGLSATEHEQPTAKPTTTADTFDQLVHALLERKGRFQLVLIVLLSLNSIIIGINHTITTFHIYVPKFYCNDAPAQGCGYIENGTECPSGYTFDVADDRTLAVEYETVCQRAMLAPLVNSLYFVGVTLGSLICSSLSDVYGRRKLVIICLYAQALMAVLQYYSGSLAAFTAFRLLQGFFIQGLQTCSYTLIMEYCPSKYRTIAATYWESNWAIGLGLLGAVAYFIRDWRLLTLAVTMPTLLTLSYVWLFPESIVWLESNNRRTEALTLIQKIAKFNRHTDIVEQCEAMQLTETAEKPTTSQQPAALEAAADKVGISLLMKNAVLRKHVLSMICIWFSVTLSYYGILYYLPNLAGQRHLNFEIGALIELVAYVLAYFILSTFGRRLPMAVYQYTNGCLILTLVLLTLLPEGSYGQGWVIAITLVAKGLAVSCFCGMFIYCSELLPTVCRGLGLGLCGCAARFGSLLAPQLMALMVILPQFVPLSIMSVLLLIAATTTLYLPETLLTILPNTIAEADETWGRKA